MNLQHTKATLPAAVLCIVSFICLLIIPGSYASELVYTVQTGSFQNEAKALDEFDVLMHTLNREKADFLRIEKVGKYYTVRLGIFKERMNAEKFLKESETFPGSAMIIKAYMKDERIKKIHRVSLPDDRQSIKEQTAEGQGVEKKETGVDVKADSRENKEMPVPVNFVPMKTGKLEPPPSLKRDLFSAGHSMDTSKKKADDAAANKLELKGTIIDSQDPLAIIGDEVLGVGGSVEGFKVKAIKNDKVTLSKGGSHYILRMKKE